MSFSADLQGVGIETKNYISGVRYLILKRFVYAKKIIGTTAQELQTLKRCKECDSLQLFSKKCLKDLIRLFAVFQVYYEGVNFATSY